MSQTVETQTRTLTALYRDAEQAERAVARLRAAGIEDRAIGTRTGEADGRGGLIGGLFDFLMPEPDRRRYAEAVGECGILVVVRDVPAAVSDRALDILDEEAADLHESRERPGGARRGAEGTLSGAGRATRDRDRLTGRPMGSGEASADDGSHGLGGGGSATGAVDRLTGERIGRPEPRRRAAR